MQLFEVISNAEEVFQKAYKRLFFQEVFCNFFAECSAKPHGCLAKGKRVVWEQGRV